MCLMVDPFCGITFDGAISGRRWGKAIEVSEWERMHTHTPEVQSTTLDTIYRRPIATGRQAIGNIILFAILNNNNNITKIL